MSANKWPDALVPAVRKRDPEGVPNLDAESIQDLRKDKLVFLALARYCRLTEDARRQRKAGKIETALILEAGCQVIYTNLPAWAKW